MQNPAEKLLDLSRSPFGVGRLKTLQLISAAMLSGAFLIGLVFYFLAPTLAGGIAEKPEKPDLIQLNEQEEKGLELPMLLVAGLMGIGSATFCTAFTLYQSRRNRDALAGADGAPSIEQIINSTFTVGILTNAVMEGAFLVSCLFGMVANDPGPFFAVAAVILVLWAARFPTRSRFERVLGLGE